MSGSSQPLQRQDTVLGKFSNWIALQQRTETLTRETRRTSATGPIDTIPEADTISRTSNRRTLKRAKSINASRNDKQEMSNDNWGEVFSLMRYEEYSYTSL